MKTSRWLIIWIALNIVACLIVAALWWSLQQQCRLVRDELAWERGRTEREISRRKAEWDATRRETETVAAATRAKIAAAAAARPAPTSQVEVFEQQRNTFADRLRSMPEYTSYLVRNARREVIEQSAPAIDALKLDAAQRDRLVQLLAERDLAVRDAWVLIRAQGQDPDSAAAMQVRRQIAEESSAKIRVLLGEPGYSNFQEQLAFQQQRRYVLDGVNDELAARKLPSLAEAELLACHRAHSAALSQLRRPQSREQWAAAIRPHVAATLSPAQVDVLIEHTYASIRRTVLRVEAMQRLANRG